MTDENDPVGEPTPDDETAPDDEAAGGSDDQGEDPSLPSLAGSFRFRVSDFMPKDYMKNLVGDPFEPMRKRMADLFENLIPKHDFAKLSDSLIKPIQIEILKPEYPVLQDYMKSLFKDLDFESLAKAAERAAAPRNLRGRIDGTEEVLWDVMLEEGLPFFLVPDADTAEMLLAEPDAVGRHRVLVQRRDEILASCEEVLDLCTDPDLAFLGSMLREAVATLRDGHESAAQALAANVLDGTLREFEHLTMRETLVGKKTLKGGIKGADYVTDHLPFQAAIALAPVVKAHAKDEAPAPPATQFTRNGTAHRLTPQQYTTANTIHAIMLAASILGFVQGLW